MEYDKQYSALVSSFSPWNGTIIPVIPWFVLKRDTRKLNRGYLHLEYIPILLIFTALFMASSLALLPFAYLKGIFLKIVRVAQRKDRLYWSAQMLIFLLFGPLILIANFLCDVFVFWVHLYQFRVPLRKAKVKIKAVLPETFSGIVETALKVSRNKTVREVPLVDFVKLMSARLQILETIRCLIFTGGPGIPPHQDLLRR